MKTQSTFKKTGTFKAVVAFCLLLGVSLFSASASAQTTERTVKGVVSTTDGKLPYATVMLKGTNVGVATGENGEFTFPKMLKENDVLQVSYLGYKDFEITIKGDTTYIEPFLEDIPLVIVAALRTSPVARCTTSVQN